MGTERIVRPSEVHNKKLRDGTVRPGKLGCSKAQLYRLVASGLIEPPIRLSEDCTGWRESYLDRWIAEREAESKAAAAGRRKTYPVAVDRHGATSEAIGD